MNPRTLLFSLLLLFVPSLLRAQEPVDTTATIAAWNVRGIPEISRARASQIALGIAYIDPEVIALTEVAPHKAANWIVADLKEKYGAEYEVQFPGYDETQPGDTEDSQASLGIAVLYKKGVKLTKEGSLIAGSNVAKGTEARGRMRKAISVGLKIGNFDFTLVAVHFKSSRSGKDQRNKQCEKVAEHVRKATTGSEKDILVVGDYNMVPQKRNGRDDSDNFDALNPERYLQFISRGDMCSKGTHIRNGRLGNFLDGFAISFEHTNEYLDGSLRVYPLHLTMRRSLGGFEKYVADHLPLVAKFDVSAKDDD